MLQVPPRAEDLHSPSGSREWTKFCTCEQSQLYELLTINVHMKFSYCQRVILNRNCHHVVLLEQDKPLAPKAGQNKLPLTKRAILHALKHSQAQTVRCSSGNGKQTFLGTSCYWEEKRGCISRSL